MPRSGILSRLAAVSALAAASLLSLPARADINNIFNLGLVGPSGVSMFVQQPLAGLPTFLDTFNFSVAGGTTSAVAVSTTLNLPGVGDIFHISGLQMTLFDSLNIPLAAGFEAVPGAGISLQANLFAGNYHAVVAGDADGLSGGLYTFAIASVPESGSIPMLLTGAAVIGLIARRRLRG